MPLTLLAGCLVGFGLATLIDIRPREAVRVDASLPPPDASVPAAGDEAGETADADANAPDPQPGPVAQLPAAGVEAPEPTDPVDTEAGVPGETAAGEAAPDAAPLAAGRVVVHAPRSVAGDVRRDAVEMLREGHWPVDEPRTSPFTIRETHVRFYHPEDRAAAEVLAAQFSAEARDFTAYSPRPEAGLLEVWLAGRAPGRGSGRGRPAPQNPAQAINGFLERLGTTLDNLN
jgi:hypothetical protein